MRIILLGFRYSGKSTIGKTLSKLHNLRFVDIDFEIEKRQKKTIGEIVKENGWEYFRKLELIEYKQHINDKNVVISCGGGFAVNDYFDKEEKELLKKDNGIKILLEIDRETLVERIKKSKQRPNIESEEDIFIENINLYEKRYDSYNSLDFDVKIDTSRDDFADAIFKKTLCCVIGYPVWHSLSPKIHNFLYKITNLNDFVYTKCEIKQDKFNRIKEIIKILNFRGISITSPYKQEVMKIADLLSDEATKIGAVNTIFVDNQGKLLCYNTDYIGVLKALEENTNLENKKIAIFGSGGGAKSAVIACLKKTKNITLFNRTKEKNDDFARYFCIKSCNLNDFNSSNFDIIINATTLGLCNNQSILKSSQILNEHVVFDMVYNPLKTKLLKNAISKGAKIIYGTDMLIYQAIEQYKIYTGIEVDKQQVFRLKENMVKKNHNSCLVVIGRTIKDMIKNLTISQQKSDFIEIRMDYLSKIDKGVIDKIADKICVDCIFTCRNVIDGGEFKGTYEEQKKIIDYAIGLNKFSYFDIDFSQVGVWKNELKNKRTYKIILSYHNFSKCLSFEESVKMIDDMLFSCADIAKIACKISTSEDIYIMLKVLEKYKKEGKKIIFAPMSDDKIVRLLASRYGSWTNFVCLEKENNTAKGQFCIDNYNKIIELM